MLDRPRSDAEIERDTKLAALETERVKRDGAKWDYWGKRSVLWAALVGLVGTTVVLLKTESPKPPTVVIQCPDPRSQSPSVMNDAAPDAASTHAEPEYLTVEEVADRLRVNSKTVHKMIAAKQLRSFQVGKVIRVPSSALPR